MSSYEQIADLPLKIDSYELEGLEFEAPGFTRLTTVIHLKGDGEEGVGEDVVYDALDHVALQDAGPDAGPRRRAHDRLLLEAARRPRPVPRRRPSATSRANYRRWAFESAALDLALRQAGTSLHEHLGREPKPVNFVVSMRLAPIARGGRGARALDDRARHASGSRSTRPCASSSTRPTTGTTS